MGRGLSNQPPRQVPATRLIGLGPIRALAALLLAALLFSTPALAQEPATPDAPEPAPVELPVESGESPSEPVDPVQDESPDESTDEAPNESLPEPTDGAWDEPPGEDEEDGDSAEPPPALAYRLGDRPVCEPLPESPVAVASGGAIEYACTSAITLFAERIAPAGVTIAWSVEASAGGGWASALLPPVNDPGDFVEWIASVDGAARFSFDQREPAGSSLEPGSFEARVEIAYRLLVHRPVCALNGASTLVAHAVTIGSADAAPVNLDTAAREPLRLEPVPAALPDPGVEFAAPLNFGQIGATAAGLVETRRSGTLELIISGLDQTCGEWTLHLAATPIVDAAGEPRAGFRLLLTGVNGDPLPGEECDLAAGCIALALTGGPNAPAMLTITLTITLQAPQQASLGAFGTTLDATMIAATVAEPGI